MQNFLTCILSLVSLAALGIEERMPLDIQFPKPLFVGTPRPIDLPNLEPIGDGKGQKMVLVPAGVVLVSKGKNVTSSDPYPVIGELEFITDGDKTGVDDSIVELGSGPQWVQIDLGAPIELAAIAVWHFHSQARAYHDFIVQISDDSEFKSGVRTLFNNDIDNSTKLGKGLDPAYIETYRGRVIDVQGTTARYVRLYSNGNSTDEFNHYCEVEVYGLPGN